MKEEWTLLVSLEPPYSEPIRCAVDISGMQAECFMPLPRDHDLEPIFVRGFEDVSRAVCGDEVAQSRRKSDKSQHLARRKWLAENLAKLLAAGILKALEERDPVHGYSKQERQLA